MNTELLVSLIPQTTSWSTNMGLIMIISNIICLIINRYKIQIKSSTNPSLINGPFSNFTLPELLASMSLGHILGCGIILGLGYIGSL